MTIYILDQDITKSAQYLDDKSLDRQIKDIAQVLCNVHHYEPETDLYKPFNNCPLNFKEVPYSLIKWSQWTRKCVANYKYLAALLDACLTEYWNRFVNEVSNPDIGKYNRLTHVIGWCIDSVPDLPDFSIIDRGKNKVGLPIVDKVPLDRTSFPLFMPKKYIQHSNDINGNTTIENLPEFQVIASYRNYYQSQLKNRLKNCKECDAGNAAFDCPACGDGYGCSHYERCDICDGEGYTNIFKWTQREKPEWLNLEDK